jgi:hypothetical protein
MKTNTNRIKNIVLTLATAFAMFAFSSCSTKANFLPSEVVPAAQGSVTVKEDGNKNYTIKIQISNLADSKNLTPLKNVYVVWLLPENNTPKNIGQIVSSTGTLSNKLKASFQTVSSFKPSKIFITAEDEANVQYPYSDVVLTTDFIQYKN